MKATGRFHNNTISIGLGYLLLLSVVLLFVQCKSTKETTTNVDESQAILKTMQNQEEAWNRGDIPAFMEGYLKSETLTFIGSKGVTNGWEQTLANYLKGYPDTAAMGTLTFDVIELRRLGPKAYYMIGKYTLKRSSDEPSGYFNLIWEKVDGQWVITSDHTSG